MEVIILFCWSLHTIPLNYFLLESPAESTESYQLFQGEF